MSCNKSRIPAPGTSRIPAPGTSRICGNASASTSASGIPQGGKSRLMKFESRLKKFDRTVQEELKRRRDVNNVLVEATTSDPDLRDAVDHLARAQAAHVWAGAVHAAEQAAAAFCPAEDVRQVEEAAAQSARNFQTEIIDRIEEDIPGDKPVQVLGYVGITRPKRPAR